MLPNPWIILGAVAIWIASLFAGYGYGVHEEREAQQIEIGKQKDIARSAEDKLRKEKDAIIAQLQADKNSVSDQLVTAIDELRNRPERLPESSRAACHGASGAELSGPDAKFLAREAARADKLRAEHKACREWAKKITYK